MSLIPSLDRHKQMDGSLLVQGYLVLHSKFKDSQGLIMRIGPILKKKKLSQRFYQSKSVSLRFSFPTRSNKRNRIYPIPATTKNWTKYNKH